jgi:UDP-N-acetylmuramyl pentapeptide phosphotransferase/UDP-N-acetylglucosamine-1-phosphate transferase
MLDILSFGVLGFWIGFVIRQKLKRQVLNGQRFGVAAGIAVVFVVLFVLLGVSQNAVGRWSAFAALGTYWGLGLVDDRAAKLSKSWAEFWLPLLFIALEVARTFAVAAYCQQFKWAC